MKQIYSLRRFTLVELLIVVGIVAVLAGLVLPAVIGGIQQGRITQAKSDLASIMMALKGVEGTYGKMVKKSGSNYSFDGNGLDAETNGNSSVITLGGSSNTNQSAYNAFIAELTVPGNSGFANASERNINARKIKFLEPRADFDPTVSYANQAAKLWRDPWGNPYVILINVNGTDEIRVNSNKTIAAKAAGYSFGPNGADNQGCNVNLGTCIHTSDSSNHKLHDDITSWD